MVNLRFGTWRTNIVRTLAQIRTWATEVGRTRFSFQSWGYHRHASNDIRLAVECLEVRRALSTNPLPSLDPTFGDGGVVITSIGSSDDVANAMLIQPNGKIVVVGNARNFTDHSSDFAVTRYNRDGTLDLSFNYSGIVTTSVVAQDDVARAVALQADGKLIVAGYANTGSNLDFAVVRYNLDGSLDSTFNGIGKVTTGIFGDDTAEGVLVQSDGKIVVVGSSGTGSNRNVAVVRFNSNGTLDTTFDGDGRVELSISAGDDRACGVVQQADGKLVISGHAIVSAAQQFAVIRLNADGSRDATFDTDGIALTNIGDGDDLGRGVALQSDGKIVVAGYATVSGKRVFAAARYNTDGSLDNSFSGDGKFTAPTGPGNSVVTGNVVLQQDGRIILGGYASNGTNDDLVVMRLNPDGTFDTTWHGTGKQQLAVSAGLDQGVGLGVQADGKIVQAAIVTGAPDFSGVTNLDFAVVRYDSVQTILNPAPASAMSEAFLAMDTDYLLVGAKFENAGATFTGAAYLYRRSDLSTPLFKFTDPTPQINGFFGTSVALSGGLAIVGGGGDDRVYVFDCSTGNLIRTIANPSPNSSDGFGNAVAASGNYLLVGAPRDDLGDDPGEVTGAADVGTAYLFELSSGVLVRRFANPSPAAGDVFGNSVALSGTRVLIGALLDGAGDDPGETGTDNGVGAAYLFDLQSGALLHTFINPVPSNSQNFAPVVALSSNRVLLGNYKEDVDSTADVGAAYLYDAATGELIDRLANPFPNSGDWFGRYLALSDRYAVVTAFLDDGSGLSSGAAYVFDADTGAFLQQLSDPSAAAGNQFGQTVIAYGSSIAVGAGSDDTAGANAGAIHQFDLRTDTTPPRVLDVIWSANEITVVYSEAMATSGPGSIFDLENWSYLVDGEEYIWWYYDFFDDSSLIPYGWNPQTGRYESHFDVFGDGQTISLRLKGTARDAAGNLLDGTQDGTPGDDFLQARPAAAGDVEYRFSRSSYVTTSFFNAAPSNDFGRSVAVQSNGKILVAADSMDGVRGENSKIAVARYESNGMLDQSFGSGGKVVLDVSSGFTSSAQDIALQADGKIVVAGYVTDADERRHMVAIRLLANGSLDGTFGNGGVKQVGSGTDVSEAESLAIQSNGMIVLVGSYGSGDAKKTRLVRLKTDGTADGGFDGDGILDLSGAYVAHDVALQSDGKLVVAAERFKAKDIYFFGGYEWLTYDAIVLRLNANGTLDTTFGKDHNGIAVVDKGGVPTAVKLQTDGKIVLAAQKQSDWAFQEIDVYRLTAGGLVDTGFGTAGAYTAVFDGNKVLGRPEDIAIQQDGKIVVTGELEPSRWDATLALLWFRLTGSGALDGAFNGTGRQEVESTTASTTELNAVALQSDGKIVAVGRMFNPDSDGQDVYVSRLNTNGTWDTSFSTDGRDQLYFDTTLTPVENSASATVQQPDGKTVVVGKMFNGTNYDIAVARYSKDGDLDASFGIRGRFVLTGRDAAYNDFATGVVLQPDGRILISGYTSTQTRAFMLVVRLNADGTLDLSFGDHGIVEASWSTTGIYVLNDVALQSDGKILLTGYWKTSGGSAEMFVGRLQQNGAWDTSFGTGGNRHFSIGNGNDIGKSIILDGHGQIVVAGVAEENGRDQFAVVRFEADGSFDTRFDSDGIARTSVGTGDASIADIASNENGDLIAVGRALAGTQSRWAVVRYNASDGSLDPGFGANGVKVWDLFGFGNDGNAVGVALQPDGKIVVVGNYDVDKQRMAVARLNADGSYDTAFSGGRTYYLIGNGDDSAADVFIEYDGSIVVAGTTDYLTTDDDPADFFIQYINGDGAPTVYLGVASAEGGSVSVLPGYSAPGVAGQLRTYNFVARDPAAQDNAANFTYQIDWDGDGIYEQTVSGVHQTTLAHTYTTPGTYVIHAKAIDRDGVASESRSYTQHIVSATLQADQSFTKNNLIVGGTTGDDVIRVERGSAEGAYRVLVNGVSQGEFAPDGEIVVFGQAGNDILDVGFSVTAPVTFRDQVAGDTQVTDFRDQSFVVYGKSPIGTTVGTAAVSNLPLGTTVTYTIVAGNTGAFSVNASTGAVSVVDPKKLLVGQVTLTLRATDVANPLLYEDAQVVVQIKASDTPPVFSLLDSQGGGIPIVSNKATILLVENAANAPLAVGDLVGVVRAGDLDESGINLAVEMTPDKTGTFAFDPVSGRLSILNPAKLDYEKIKSINLTFKATDHGLIGLPKTMSTTLTVTIKLVDRNEAPTFPATAAAFRIKENNSARATVGTVTATDPDKTAPNKTLSYSLVSQVDQSGHAVGVFAIADSRSGKITVPAAGALNFEAAQSYTLVVRATDGAGLFTDKVVTVTVVDVNEAPTVALLDAGQNPTTTLAIAENAAAGTLVGYLRITNPDVFRAETFKVSLSDQSGALVVGPYDAATGLVAITISTDPKKAAKLDFEKFKLGRFALSAVATDSGFISNDGSKQGAKSSAKATFAVQLTDVVGA